MAELELDKRNEEKKYAEKIIQDILNDKEKKNDKKPNNNIEKIFEDINFSNKVLNGKKDDEFHIEKIDKIYEKLNYAISQKDLKMSTYYRGQLIRILKSQKKLISKKYEEVRTLIKIKELFENGKSLSTIKEELLKEDNIKYFMVFKDSLANNKAFEKSLYKICEKKQVDRIILYYNALDEELKNQKIDYQKRYDQEFLRKNENLRDTFHSLPNAMSLAVKSVATSIDELKQAKTNKMRIQKALDVVKSTGKVAITPVAYVGKFLVSAWYSLLKFNGSNIKFDEKEKDISKKEMEKEIKINKIYDDFYDELFNNSKNESEVYKYQK